MWLEHSLCPSKWWVHCLSSGHGLGFLSSFPGFLTLSSPLAICISYVCLGEPRLLFQDLGNVYLPPCDPSRHFPQLNAVYHVLGKWYYKSYISDEIREGGKKSLKGCKIKSRPWRRSELTPDRRHVTHKRRLVRRAACTLSSIYSPPREHYH